jgi:predicted lipoprotein with Yx(FWY)xxD motif
VNRLTILLMCLAMIGLAAACSSAAATATAPAPSATPTTVLMTATMPAPTATPVSGAAPTVDLGSTAALGEFLVDAQGLTLYHFDDDTPNHSNCTGSCADIWPPLTVPTGTMPSLAAGITGTLGVITRADGSDQVTYNEMPLYRYSGDTKPGETNGEGLYGLWYMVAPKS